MMGEVGTKEEKPNKNKNFLTIVRVCQLRMIGGPNELLLPVSSSGSLARAAARGASRHAMRAASVAAQE
jgi:hypothetical protein